MTKPDDAEAKQAMLKALAAYTGPITREMKTEAKTCRLSEFGECNNVFVPGKKWGEFCCTEHRKRWHYLNRTRNGITAQETYRDAVEDAESERVNGHAPAQVTRKLTLAQLGFGAPTTAPMKRRKLNTPTKAEIEQRTEERRDEAGARG